MHSVFLGQIGAEAIKFPPSLNSSGEIGLSSPVTCLFITTVAAAAEDTYR